MSVKMNTYARRKELLEHEVLTFWEKIEANHYKNGGETASSLVQGPGTYFRGFVADKRIHLLVEKHFSELKKVVRSHESISLLKFDQIDGVPLSDIVSALKEGPINATGLHWCTMKVYINSNSPH